MQSVSGFSPASQAVNANMNARASFPNKNHNLFAGGHADSFQSSQASVKFAALLLKRDAAPVKGDEKTKAVLSEDKPDSKLVANPRNGRMNIATGWQFAELKKIRNNQDLSDAQKIKKIGEIFRKTFVSMQKRQRST